MKSLLGKRSAYLAHLADDEEVSEFERGCGCDKRCYEQFSVSETCDFRLSLRELTKNERDVFLMGKRSAIS